LIELQEVGCSNHLVPFKKILSYESIFVGAFFPYIVQDTQTELGWLFEQLADLTDEDGALAEMQDLGLL